MGNNIDKERLERVKSLISEKGIDVIRMYNYDRKIQFFVEDGYSTKDSVIISIVRVFCVFGDYEHKGLKDISDFSIKEIRELLKSISFYDTTFSVKKSIIKKYMKWCYESKIISSSEIVREIAKIKNDIIPKSAMYQKSFFDSYKSLKEAIIERLTSPSKVFNEKNLYSPYVVAEYLIWYGVKPEDVVEITRFDVDFQNNRIWIKDKQLWVAINNREVMEFIDRCFKDDNYYASDYLIRTARREKIPFEVLSTWASRYFGESKSLESREKRVINYSKVYQSGQFERAYSMECEDKLSYHYIDPRVMEMFGAEAGSVAASNIVSEYYDYCDYFHPDRVKYPNIKTKIDYIK